MLTLVLPPSALHPPPWPMPPPPTHTNTHTHMMFHRLISHGFTRLPPGNTPPPTTPTPEMTEEVILNPPKVDIKLKPDNVDIAYPPLFQSGGKFDLKLNASTNDDPLHGGEACKGGRDPAAAHTLQSTTLQC